ncbi:MAG: penicillin-binding protein 2 [Acidobacteria bacterium]|nr:penicillin-binding protein 2 [Acidobacteriota bacterium]
MSTVGPWRPESSPKSTGARRRPIFRRDPGAPDEVTLESPIVRSRLLSRVRVAEGVVILMVMLLLFGFWRLQVVHAAHYRELADNNRHRNIIVRAPRGLITDRNDLLLAANRAAFNVAIVREELDDRDATLEWLAGVLGVTPDMLRERLDRRKQGIPVFQPVVIAGDIDAALVAAIEARSLEYPGVLIQPEHKRHYPKGRVAAHVMGYVGEINAAQLASWEQGRYRMGDIVGKLGLERVHEGRLSGFAGDEEIIVDSVGRTVRVLNQIPPEPGNTLTLTLDLLLQQQAEALLEGKKGAIVMLDVNTGGVLALASAPTFDPNMFARRFSQAEWNAVTNDLARPLQNRALQSAYPPGSIFKLMMAVAGLENGIITPETTVTCTGGGTYYRQYRSCNAVHGKVSLESAIGRSCNVYFYELGAKLSRQQIIEVAQRFGLGARTGIDLLNEGTGILPTDEWVSQAPPPRDGNWYPGETIGLSIGQGPIDTTPLQLAQMAATLATGVRITPHLVETVENAAGREIEMAPRNQPVDINLSPYHRAAILSGMRAATHPVTGTARRAANPDYDFGGKTGTAQVASAAAAGPEGDRPEELRNHAWFVGIAPVDAPEIAIVVFIEHGGSGGVAAAPLAGLLMTAYFESREAAQQ